MKRIIICAGEDTKRIQRILNLMTAHAHSKGLILIDDTPPAPVLEFKKHLSDELLSLDMPLIDLPRTVKDRKTIKAHRAAMRRKA